MTAITPPYMSDELEHANKMREQMVKFEADRTAALGDTMLAALYAARRELDRIGANLVAKGLHIDSGFRVRDDVCAACDRAIDLFEGRRVEFSDIFEVSA